MTKERKIAIKIWEEIKASILSSPKHVTGTHFIIIKYFLTIKYSMSWKSNCWFCHYIRETIYSNDGVIVRAGCDRCPLHKLAHAKPGKCGCNTHLTQSPYARLINNNVSNAEKAEACDMIIKALKGEE